MYAGKANAAWVATGAGTLSEFIAAVFFYLYNRTIIEMGQYHQKLVLTQNIGLALKITEELPDADRVAARRQLIGNLSENVNYYLSLAGTDSRPLMGRPEGLSDGAADGPGRPILR